MSGRDEAKAFVRASSVLFLHQRPACTEVCHHHSFTREATVRTVSIALHLRAEYLEQSSNNNRVIDASVAPTDMLSREPSVMTDTVRVQECDPTTDYSIPPN